MGFFLTFLFTISILYARTQKGIERLNFFPDSDAYLSVNFDHQELDIETPKESGQSKGVNNFANRLSGMYAQRVSRKMFLGAQLAYEEASENAVVYGIPARKRFRSSGFVDPAIIATYRLRFQKETRGMIDLHFYVSPSLGRREIGESATTRLNGRDLLRLGLSHGFLEDRWEFQNMLEYEYFSAGREDNKFLRASFDLESSWQLRYNFTTQYELSSDYDLFATFGLVYRSQERIRSATEDMREIRSGTASLYGVGIKRPLSEWTMIEGKYSLRREEYFVRSAASNLDGTSTSQTFTLSYVVLF